MIDQEVSRTMKGMIKNAVKNSNSLAQVRESLFSFFKICRQKGTSRIGYVSGVITSDGKEHIQHNIERLTRFTEHIRQGQEFPIFSATDVFDNALFARLDAAGFKNQDYVLFWREVLGARDRFVTDMFMTPRWEISQGASDEHEIAKRVGMNICYLSEDT